MSDSGDKRLEDSNASGGDAKARVVVVGAGFGGMATAKRLAAKGCSVCLIDRQNHHLFQPLLYQVATAALPPADVAMPIRRLLPRDAPAETVMDEVVAVEPERRLVRGRQRVYSYDLLVLAPGCRYAYFGHDEWRRYALPLKTLDDALRMRRRALLAFERAEIAEDPAERRRQMTFVIVGAGPTGVELAGAFAELARYALARDYRAIDPATAQIILAEALPTVLPGFPEKLQRYAHTVLERKGVTVRVDAAVEAVDAQGVTIAGQEIRAANVFWSAGTEVPDLADWLACDHDKSGRIKVEPDLSVPGRPEIFVIGDAARVEDPQGQPLPGLAAVAKQQGLYVADLIGRRLRGQPAPEAFHYRDRGTLATIGRGAAIADLGWTRLRGRVAWLLWGVAHLYFLSGLRNRLSVFLTWFWSYLTYQRGARIIIGPESEDDEAIEARSDAPQSRRA